MSVVCKRMKTFIDVKIILPFKKEIQNGQRVVIIYGNDIRVMPYEE